MRRIFQTTLLALACTTPAAWATDLLQTWQAAQQNDRELAVARAAQATAQPLRDQASALWRPGVALTASAGVATGESDMRGAQFSATGMGTSNGVNFSTSVTGGTATTNAQGQASVGDQVRPDQIGQRQVNRHRDHPIRFGRMQTKSDLHEIDRARGGHSRDQQQTKAMNG